MADLSQMRKAFFDQKRTDLERQTRGQQQEADDIITRRMTALGQAGSGAAIGAQLKARDQIQAQGAQAQNELAANELQSNIQDEQFNKEFGFKNKAFDEEMGYKKDVFGFEKEAKLKALDLEQQRIQDERTSNAFNAAMANLQSPYSSSRVAEGMNEYLKAMDDLKAGRAPTVSPADALKRKLRGL